MGLRGGRARRLLTLTLTLTLTVTLTLTLALALPLTLGLTLTLTLTLTRTSSTTSRKTESALASSAEAWSGGASETVGFAIARGSRRALVVPLSRVTSSAWPVAPVHWIVDLPRDM